MHHPSIYHKILALMVIAVLLSLPVVNVTGESVVSPFKNTLTTVSFTTNHNGIEGAPFQDAEPEQPFNGDLAVSWVLLSRAEWLQSDNRSPRFVAPPKEIHFEVYIPPEILSRA